MVSTFPARSRAEALVGDLDEPGDGLGAVDSRAGRRAQGGILAMRKILEADHFIDLPVCKNHRWAAISLSMKNLIGAIGDESRDPIHYTEGDADRISRDIAILNGAFRPLISIVDARAALINGGPEGVGADRVTVNPGLIFASRDRVALDAAAIEAVFRA